MSIKVAEEDKNAINCLAELEKIGARCEIRQACAGMVIRVSLGDQSRLFDMLDTDAVEWAVLEAFRQGLLVQQSAAETAKEPFRVVRCANTQAPTYVVALWRGSEMLGEYRTVDEAVACDLQYKLCTMFGGEY